MSSCAECQGRKYVVLRRGPVAFAEICACARSCSACGELGFVYVKREDTFSEKVGPRTYEVLRDCECRIRRGRVGAFNHARLPASCAQASFENYLPLGALARAREVARAFACGYRRSLPARGFILSGPVGTGKTHLLAATLSQLTLETGAACAYVEISFLYSAIRRGFQEGKSGGEIIGPLSEVEVLAIDELGKGRGSTFELETMDELIARRYNAGRTTLFATNYSLALESSPAAGRRGGYVDTQAQARAKQGENLLDRVSERIYSRLCEMCEFVELPASTPDHRKARAGV